MSDPNATVMPCAGEQDGDALDWIWCYAAGVLTGVAFACATVLAAVWIGTFHPEWFK